jgi:threonine dehydrogenase-like Zn-dependent dehydrogenase
VTARSVQIGDDRRLVVVDRPVPPPGPAEVEVTVTEPVAVGVHAVAKAGRPGRRSRRGLRVRGDT